MFDDIILSVREPVNCFSGSPLRTLLSEGPLKSGYERVMVQQTVKSDNPAPTTGQKESRPYPEGVVSIIEERSSEDDPLETPRHCSELPHTSCYGREPARLRKVLVREGSNNDACRMRIYPYLALESSGEYGRTTDELGTQLYS
jgi:hypothetical protein